MRTCVLPCDRPKPYLRDALMYSFEVLQPDNLHIWHDTRLFGIGRNKKLQFYGLFLNFWTKFFGTNFSMAHCVQSHISKMPYWILLEFYSMITCTSGMMSVFLELKKIKISDFTVFSFIFGLSFLARIFPGHIVSEAISQRFPIGFF